MQRNILFLNENPLPPVFARGTVSGKELRLRAAIEQIDAIHVVALPGQAVQTDDVSVGELEKKIYIHRTIPWPYYFSPVILFVYGVYFSIVLRPKIIEAESPILSGVAAVLLGKLFRIPVLVEVRASYDELIKVKAKVLPYHVKKAILERVLDFVLSHSNVIVANSRTYQKQIQRRGFDAVVINPGLQYPPKKRLVHRDRKIIGFLGRLVPEKGVDYLLRACTLIEADLIDEGWSIEIAGDGPERDTLEALAHALFKGSQLTVTFLGFVNNYWALSRFSLLVNPCWVQPPLEMVNIEAAYMRIPVVCFGTKEMPETVIDGKTGVKVSTVSPQSLARGIKKAMTSSFGNEQFDCLARQYSFLRQRQILLNLYLNHGFLK